MQKMSAVPAKSNLAANLAGAGDQTKNASTGFTEYKAGNLIKKVIDKLLKGANSDPCVQSS